MTERKTKPTCTHGTPLGSECENCKTLTEIEPISKGHICIKTREQIKEVVEKPLLTACEKLYDKNIRTLATSANQKDLELGEVYILIDFDSLSEENQKVAQQYSTPQTDSGHWGGGQTIKVTISVSELATIDEISDKAMAIVETFYDQPATWIPKRKIESFTATLDDIKKGFSLEGPEYDDPESDVWKDLGYDYDPIKKVFYSKERLDYYHDPDEDVYYMSEEHYKKANEENE